MSPIKAADLQTDFTANTRPFDRGAGGVERDLNRIAGMDPSVEFDADTRKAQAKLGKVESTLSTLTRQIYDVNVDVDDRAAIAKLRSLDRTLANIGVGVDVDVDTTEARSRIAALSASISGSDAEINVRADTRNAERSVDRLADKVERLGKGFVGFKIITNLVQWPAIIGGATLAGGALTALTAAAAGTVGALGPLTGLVPALGAGLVAAGQGAGVLALAFSGFDDAIKKPEEATGAMRELVDEILGAKPAFEGLREVARESMFPGLIDAIHTLTPMMERFEPIVRGTARMFAELARSGSELVASPAFSGRLYDVGRGNIDILRTMGEAAVTLATPLMTLVQAAQPLVATFAGWLNLWAGNIAGMVASAEASGRLAGFFERTHGVASQLANILGNLATGLFNIFAGGADMGQGVLDSLDRITQRFADWTSSVEGSDAISDWFDRVQPTVDALGRLFSDTFALIGRVLGDSATTAAPFVDSIRTDLLPAVEGIATSVSGPFMESLIQLGSTVGALAPLILGSTGALTVFLELLNLILTPMVWLTTNVPGAATAIATLAGAFGLFTAVSWIVGLFTGIGGAIAGMVGFVGGAIPAVLGLAAALWTVIAPLLPIIAGVAAVIAIGYLLVTHWDTIKEAASAVWQWIQGVFHAGVEFVKGVIVDVIGFLAGSWAAIVGTVQGAWAAVHGAITGAIGGAVDFVQGMVSGVIGFLAGAWSSIVGTVQGAWSQIVGAVSGAISEVIGVVSGLPGRVLGAIGDMGSLLYNAGRRVISGFIDGIKSMIGNVGSAIGGVVGKVKGFLPFSPAKEGPLSGRGNPFYSGQSIGKMLAAGLRSQLPTLSATLGGLDLGMPGIGRAQSAASRANVPPIASASNHGSGGDIVIQFHGPFYGGEAGLRELERRVAGVAGKRNYRSGR